MCATATNLRRWYVSCPRPAGVPPSAHIQEIITADRLTIDGPYVPADPAQRVEPEDATAPLGAVDNHLAMADLYRSIEKIAGLLKDRE
jgi:hypothetical protein